MRGGGGLFSTDLLQQKPPELTQSVFLKCMGCIDFKILLLLSCRERKHSKKLRNLTESSFRAANLHSTYLLPPLLPGLTKKIKGNKRVERILRRFYLAPPPPARSADVISAWATFFLTMLGIKGKKRMLWQISKGGRGCLFN